MLVFDREQHRLVGPQGSLPVLEEDDITRKLVMLIEGECDALGPRRRLRHSASASLGTTKFVRPFNCMAPRRLRARNADPNVNTAAPKR
jgi:hypothetical protein